MQIVLKSPAIITHAGLKTPVNLYDKLTFKKLGERKIQILKTSGFKIPTNDINPVYKVAVALQNLRPNKLGVVINIQKNSSFCYSSYMLLLKGN